MNRSLNIATWELMIGLGFLVAASVRISNELGRGNTKAAKFSIKVILRVAIGAGLQSVVAYVNIGCYYMVGVPIGALLGYVAHREVKGIWIGMICGVAIQALSLLFMTWRTDWEKQVTRASERLNRWLLNAPDQESNQSLIQNSE
ncbi:hypothetical protein Patl1_23583 [Pistacia atlantica]|uniref:Uncharacterized protein n=1 Tax=Pistacia atlantica TaxID=434234 RepID=A0ACC0ZX28_9ROSI|nr:hypothetical protein Patl1_23583 [Pistacia atlantica]